ncbi:hypothetical protein [Planomonospora sp. ID82291]|uniref:hypothetical protein n=1 Tax=Planomonospora sp. ID82291 TaxID=2738136 RepID=UPI0018C40933|nr:hypothetical protein [Planomonospora sp. ID82291]MBG0819028.1 hypothetical protein [Planomonospora sp. ID82291]
MSAVALALVVWVFTAVPLVVVAAVFFYVVGERVGRTAGERKGRALLAGERERLARRLETITTLLQPFAAAMRAGRRDFSMPSRDLAVLALLVDEPGEGGDVLADLEEMFHDSPPH